MGRLADFGWDLTGRFVALPPVPELPVGGVRELPGRGSSYIIDTGMPPGRPDAPTLVLLHALACTALLSWYPSLGALAARYRVVMLDQRWHGRGIRSPHFRLEDCADDVVALADTLGVERVIPVGYSMGALVAQLVARRHPSRIDGLVLGAATMRFRRGEADPFALRILAGRIGQLSERRLRGGPFAAPHEDGHDANRWAREQFRSTSRAEIAGATSVIARFDSTRWAGQISAPAAVVITTKDHAIPASHQRALVRTLRNASCFEVEAGHAALVLNAALFTPALLAACASVAMRRTAARAPQ
jgi:3-oxoadipate enol-lactonase